MVTAYYRKGYGVMMIPNINFEKNAKSRKNTNGAN